MPVKQPRHRALNDVVNAFQSSGRLTVLAGAGISRTAGIPLAGEIVLAIAERLCTDEGVGAHKKEDIQRWLENQPFYDRENHYASVLDAAFPNPAERARYFEELMLGARPGKTHLVIAKLIQHRVVRCVLTTNFDRLMEYAIVRVCRQMPCALMFDEVPLYVDMQSARPKVFKLHGDYLFGNVRNLGHELYLVKESMSKKIEMGVREGTLIVAGYSGGDQSVMQVLQNLAKQKDAFPGGVYWLTLKGASPNERVSEFLHTVADRGSGIVETEGSDAFFDELARCLSLPSESPGPHLDIDDSRMPLAEAAVETFVRDRLPGLAGQEFLALLRKSHALSDSLRSGVGIDYLMARFEECGEIPRNLGELVDRYVDLVVGGAVCDPPCAPSVPTTPSKANRRRNELVQTGLIRKDEAETEIRDACLGHYLGALQLLDEGLDETKIRSMLEDNAAYARLGFYVGLIGDATAVVNSALHRSVDSIVLYGRTQPWPEAFCRAAALVGRASRVNPGEVERITDMLCMEFDTERWYPRRAITALSEMGSAAVEQLIQYMLDSLQETFSREDAALALGAIGTRQVVDRLAAAATGLNRRDTKMVVYALGQTGNPRGIEVLRSLASNVGVISDWVLQNALQALGYRGGDIVASGPDEGADPRPEVDVASVIRRYIPDLEDGSTAAFCRTLFVGDPAACMRRVNKEMSPRDAVQLRDLGVTLLAHSQPWEAEAVFVECLDRYPMIDAHYHNLALAYSREGRPLAARRYYAMGLSLDPDYSDYYNDFGVTMMKLDNLEAARYLLVHAAVRDFDNYRPWFNLANVNLRESGCMADMKAGVSPSGMHAYPGLGLQTHELAFDAVWNAGRLTDACVCLRQVLTLNPSHPAAGLMLEQLSVFAGQAARGEPTPNELVAVLHAGEVILPDSPYIDDLPEDARRAWHLSADHLYQGHLPEAIADMKEVLRLYPNSPDVYLNLSVLCGTAGLLDDAIDYLAAALRKWPWDYHLLLNYSTYLLRSQRPKDAVGAAEEAIRVQSQNAASWLQLGRALRANSQTGEAKAAYKEAIRFAPRWSFLEARAKDELDEMEARTKSPSP